jgi:hypothetical protein
MKNLLFWTKFYWSWTGGPVLIVRTDLVINSKGSILDFKRYNIGSWLPQTNAYVPPIPFLCYRYWVPQTNTYAPPIPFLCYRYWVPQTNTYVPLSHSCVTDTGCLRPIHMSPLSHSCVTDTGCLRPIHMSPYPILVLQILAASDQCICPPIPFLCYRYTTWTMSTFPPLT